MSRRRRKTTARSPLPVVPFGRGGTDRFVPWMIAPMVYLATLALITALAVGAMAERWEAGLTGTMTAEIPAPQDPADRDRLVEAAIRVLDDWPGVASAAPLDEGRVETLLEPWLGTEVPLGELPLPTLIEITLAEDAAVETPALAAALDSAAPGTVLDDHGRWREDLRAMAGTIRLVALVLVFLIGLAAVAAIVSVSRAGFAIHAPVIDLLHVMGATDRYIARQFERHAFRLAARGAAAGLLLTCLTLAGLSWGLAGVDRMLLPGLALGGSAWIALALVPVGTAILAMGTARITVLRALARLP